VGNAAGAEAEVEKVLPFLTDFSAKVRLAAIQTLGSLVPKSAEYADDIVRFLAADDPKIVGAAAACLAAMDVPSTMSSLTKALGDSNPLVVADVLRAIGGWKREGDKVAADVAKCLEHKEGIVRGAAVQALTSLGDAASLTYAKSVAKLLGDESGFARMAAVAFFEAKGKSADSVAGDAAAFLNNKDGRFQAAGALALGAMKSGKSAGDVAKLLTSTYEDETSMALSGSGLEPKLPVTIRKTSCAAAMSLGMMGADGKPHAGAISKLLDPDQPPEVLACFVKAIGHIGDPECLASSEELVENTSPLVRSAVCFALGEFAKTDESLEAVEMVAGCLGDSSTLVKVAALKALKNMKEEGPQFSDKVVLLFNDRVNDVKICALETLAEMGDKGTVYAQEVCRLMYDEVDAVRVKAIEVLAGMGERGAAFADEIASVLSSRSGPARLAALKALAKIGDEAEPLAPEVAKMRKDPIDAVSAAAEECYSALMQEG